MCVSLALRSPRLSPPLVEKRTPCAMAPKRARASASSSSQSAQLTLDGGVPHHPNLAGFWRDEQLTDMVTSLYLSAVISAGYQLMPEDAQDFSTRVARMVGSGLDIASDAELAPELDVTDEPEDVDEEAEEEEEEEESTDKDEV